MGRRRRRVDDGDDDREDDARRKMTLRGDLAVRDSRCRGDSKAGRWVG